MTQVVPEKVVPQGTVLSENDRVAARLQTALAQSRALPLNIRG